MPGPSKEPAKTWRSVAKSHAVRGPAQIKYKKWIAKLYKKHGPGTPFTLEDMMSGCDTDMNDRRVYARAHAFLIHMRKEFLDVMENFFVPGGAYERHKASGKSDSDIFAELVNAAVSHEVYPVWSDFEDEFQYKLFALGSFAFLITRRARAITSEIKEKAHTVGIMSDKLPKFAENYHPPSLSGTGKLLQLPGATLSTEDSDLTCERCHQVFHTTEELGNHYLESHASDEPKEPERPQCPLCEVTLLPTESGKLLCPDCRQQFDPYKDADQPDAPKKPGSR